MRLRSTGAVHQMRVQVLQDAFNMFPNRTPQLHGRLFRRDRRPLPAPSSARQLHRSAWSPAPKSSPGTPSVRICPVLRPVSYDASRPRGGAGICARRVLRPTDSAVAALTGPSACCLGCSRCCGPRCSERRTVSRQRHRRKPLRPRRSVDFLRVRSPRLDYAFWRWRRTPGPLSAAMRSPRMQVANCSQKAPSVGPAETAPRLYRHPLRSSWSTTSSGTTRRFR